MQTFHFCAMKQIPNGIGYFDGTLTTNADLKTEEGYQSMKKAVGERFDPPSIAGEGITILSLTPIDA